MATASIQHGPMSPAFIGGPFAVFYVRDDGRIGASVTGIRSAKACDEHAIEYSRCYDAPIITPMRGTVYARAGMTAINIKLEVSDALCASVMCTALEGGIGYWCCAGDIKRTDAKDWDYVSFVAYDAEDNDELHGRVDYTTIALGIERLLSGAVKVRADIRASILADVKENEGNIDSDAADCIVQAGLFNEIVYG